MSWLLRNSYEVSKIWPRSLLFIFFNPILEINKTFFTSSDCFCWKTLTKDRLKRAQRDVIPHSQIWLALHGLTLFSMGRIFFPTTTFTKRNQWNISISIISIILLISRRISSFHFLTFFLFWWETFYFIFENLSLKHPYWIGSKLTKCKAITYNINICIHFHT